MQQWEKKLEEARRFFGIENYPGNLFEFFSDYKSVIDKYNLLLFKQDIDKLSGFIGYNNGYTIICVNYKRNIGHQNFTLAHELGHMFLHNGISKSDINPERPGFDTEELEANKFASELIYPQNLVNKDFQYIIENDLLDQENWDELADYINSLCEIYYTSFKFTFYKLTGNSFGTYSAKNKFYKRFTKYIGKLSSRFSKFMHVADSSHEFYQPYYEPYNYMKVLVKELIKEKELGLETGDAIIDRYEYLEG